jgi:hypothetical protein
MVEELQYLGTTLTNGISIQKEIKSSCHIGNACCHSVQNLFSFSLLSKQFKDQDIQNYNFACYFV